MRWFKGALVVAAGCALAGCGVGAAGAHRSAATAKRRSAVVGAAQTTLPGVHWVLASGALRRLEQAGGASWASAVFRPQTTTLIVAPSAIGQWSSWQGHIWLDATSLAGVRAALAVATPGDAVLLDLEHWSRTPMSEQLNAAATYEHAAALAEEAHVPLVAAPATDLALVLTPGLRVTQGFLSSGIVQAAARGASVFEVQAQGLETNPARYVSYVRAVVAQARQANPSIGIVLGLSTNPSGEHVAASELREDIALTRSFAQGYWLNVPQGGASCPRCGVAQPEVAVALLKGSA